MNKMIVIELSNISNENALFNVKLITASSKALNKFFLLRVLS